MTHNKVKRLGKTSWLIEWNHITGRRAVLKCAKKHSSRILRLLRPITNLSFDNELQFYKSLEAGHPVSKVSQYTPMLLDFQDGEYFVVDYLPHLKIDSLADQKIPDLLSLFNFSEGVRLSKTGLAYWAWTFLLSDLRKVLLRAIRLPRKVLPRKDLWRVIVLSKKLRADQPKFDPVLIHNDFHRKNVLVTPEGELRIIDFAPVAYETTWVLRDIINAAFSVRELTFRSAHLMTYLEKTRLSFSPPLTSELIWGQIRHELLLRLVFSLRQFIKEDNSRLLATARKFMIDIVLDDVGFASWAKEQGLSKLYPIEKIS